MNKKQTKFTVASIAIVLAIGYLILSGISNTAVYYLTVSEFLEKKESLYDESVRIQGKVVGGSINKNIKTLNLNFDIADEKSPPLTMKVTYKGVVPDLFEADREVVIEGKYSNEEIFFATSLLTSCPSKYEASESSKSQKGEKL